MGSLQRDTLTSLGNHLSVAPKTLIRASLVLIRAPLVLILALTRLILDRTAVASGKPGRTRHSRDLRRARGKSFGIIACSVKLSLHSED
jgi:hypothetical protein